jgi:hypothetical protein
LLILLGRTLDNIEAPPRRRIAIWFAHGARRDHSRPPAGPAQADPDPDRNRSTKTFRELLKEIGMLLCYEVTRDLPLTRRDRDTLARMIGSRIAGKKLVFALCCAPG